ncbi:MAG: hypothetical protein ABIH46_04485, partial [Chloroflexota bacterium]
LVYLVVALALLEPLGMPGLALANSAQWISHALVMLILLWRGVGSLSGLGLRVTTLKVVAASATMGAALFVAMPLLEGILGAEGTVGLLVHVALLSGGGALVYGVSLVLLRVQEVGILWTSIRARFTKQGQGAS